MLIPYFHCLACERLLSEFEIERKFVGSGTFVGLCNKCFAPISNSVPVDEQLDLGGVDVDEVEDRFESETENDS